MASKEASTPGRKKKKKKKKREKKKEFSFDPNDLVLFVWAIALRAVYK